MATRTHLNTLFVLTDDTYLAKEGEAVLVKQGDTTPLRVPIHMLQGIVFLARPRMSPYVMALCAKRDVTVSFLEPTGRFLARIEGRRTSNVLLRKDQFRAAESPVRALEYAKAFVQGKIHNSRIVLKRAIRDHGDGEATLEAAVQRLAGCLRRAGGAGDLDALRGIEGEAARHYFATFSQLIRTPDTRLRMTSRSRRPPLDRANAVLSFLYALLAADARSACESAGLDPQVGYLHADRSGRASLALDLAEEFRAVIADRVALSLLNRQQITAGDFECEEAGAVRLGSKARKACIVEYQKRKQEELKHPFLGERITLGLAPLLQARLLSRALRGDTDGYPPFLWR